MAIFHMECLFHRMRIQGPTGPLLRQTCYWFRRAPLVVTRQILRLTAIHVLPKSVVRVIVARKQRRLASAGAARGSASTKAE